MKLNFGKNMNAIKNNRANKEIHRFISFVHIMALFQYIFSFEMERNNPVQNDSEF